MRIPVYVAVAQWVLLMSLAVLVAFMFRQLGRHLSAARPAGQLGPEVGSPAATLEYYPVSAVGTAAGGGRAGRPARGGTDVFQPGGRAALLAFVEPTCPACEDLVASLNDADAAGELAQVSALLLISEPPGYLQISEPFRQTRLPLGRIAADATLEAYRVSATPLLVAIDGAGAVRASGPASRRDDVRGFVRACLRPAPATLPLAGAGPERRPAQS